MSATYWRILLQRTAQGRGKNAGKLLAAALTVAPLIKDSTAEQKALEEEKAAKKAEYKQKMMAKQHPNENFPIIQKQVPRSPMTTIQSSFDPQRKKQRGRSVGDNLFIPIGVVATGGAIVYMMYAVKKGDRKAIVTGAKYRIAFQSFTFMAAVLGVAYYSIFDDKDDGE